jgi:hypothetical protein
MMGKNNMDPEEIRARKERRDETSSRFASLDYVTMANLLVNPSVPLESKLLVVSKFADLRVDLRSQHLIEALRIMLREPEEHDEDLMLNIVDILATDPDPGATEAMIRGLELVALAGLSSDKKLSEAFRHYYYTATMTRQREGDIEKWKALLPELSANTLLSLQMDPAAEPVRQHLDPMKLINRLPEPERSRTLRAMVLGGDARSGWRAVRSMLSRRDE